MHFPLKTILIDDEPLALSRLRRLLQKYPDTFHIIGEAQNGVEGLVQINQLQPDLIFLDIEMPLLNGFEMLAKLSRMPMVIFSTAFDQYAVRAFEEKSVDYLLKPVEDERLQKTIEKLRNMTDTAKSNGSNPYTENLLRLLEEMKPKKEIFSLSVKSGDRILLIQLTEITHFEAEEKYVFLNTLDGQKYLLNYTLTSLEEKLPDHFLRISRAGIVNSHHIKEIRKHFNGKFTIMMRDRKASQLSSGSTYGDVIRHLTDN
ncbi:DNA-binding response regulator [Dyadobacter luteus]|jgi:two-component system LytT family response regulator|uniref:DNA-binding response regulator n=1 Tax=Dyadobacter luteus TaxID=2259619 RepID=A0A3D8YCR3_9BACT|nr:LytTR family transcriptional regulator DNA-binding domain-containing protein [Dyadobacter luteus]REA62176.1 DNA-binding response regulator [Dyadobacter luteus]